MIDPLITIVIATSLALLFLLAARHKISAHRRFEAQLAAYRILPDSLVSPVARVLPWLEIAVAASLLFAITRPVGAVLAAAMLTLYALAMGINLKRGRSQIDCGCGDTPQSLSALLLLRNCVLTVGALLLLAPVATRPLNTMDMLFAVLFVAACSFSYSMFEQLSRNHTLLIDKE
ncbi:MauE/DoxX family redox-associated membrane protein [Pseudohongiella acticola]|uniref:MauE/DoxX family redox-associated membrane protein n=1 Tax=Pseudohongiella acticola TaxID=1524254 RepID=UPI0030EEF140